jgi:type IX secretion system PorP/SprF family membrane protein
VNDFGNYNYHLQAGYLLRLAENWKVLPSVLIRYAPAAFPQADINAYVIYRDKIWLGTSFRTSQSLIGLIMYQLNNQFSLGYSYDMGWGSSGKPLGGTHEIMIRYDFKYLLDVISPRYF